MDAQSITAEQLMEQLQGEFRALAEKIAATVNAAKAGRIIADTEEPVRGAHAVFRQQAYQKAIDLLGEKASKEAFPPESRRRQGPVEE